MSRYDACIALIRLIVHCDTETPRSVLSHTRLALRAGAFFPFWMRLCPDLRSKISHLTGAEIEIAICKGSMMNLIAWGYIAGDSDRDGNVKETLKGCVGE